MVTYNQLIKAVKGYKPRNAYERGVKKYAIEILERRDPKPREQIDVGSDLWRLEDKLLDNAGSWGNYSWGGCSLIEDHKIAKRLLTPYEYKVFCTPDGRWAYRDPNPKEQWLDVQTRALYQAAQLILKIYDKMR